MGLTSEKEKHVKDAIIYVYQNLKAMLNYSYNNFTLKGPITILKKRELTGDVSIKKVWPDSVHKVKN